MIRRLSKIRRIIFIFLMVSVILLINVACSPHEDRKITSETTLQRLNISVTIDTEAGYIFFEPDKLGNNQSVTISYGNISSVKIDIDGTLTRLEDAIIQQLITPEEIFAYAQIDARNGICDMEIKSINGLTYHIFTYPMYDLAVVYDILESPGGEQHLIHTMTFDKAYSYRLEDMCIVYTEDTTGEALDREDWGLSLEPTEISPTGLTVSCEQQGGHQFGQLVIETFILYSYDKNSIIGGYGKLENNTIQMNKFSEIQIDWSKTHGKLTPGNYYIQLSITDQYDPSLLHPLTQNYYDTQSYKIEFTIS